MQHERVGVQDGWGTLVQMQVRIRRPGRCYLEPPIFEAPREQEKIKVRGWYGLGLLTSIRPL